MNPWPSCCGCGQRLAAGLTGGLMLFCEACEVRERAEPPPPPPAVRKEEPAQLHVHTEMDAEPLAVEPAAVAPGGAVKEVVPPQAVKAIQPEDHRVGSDGSATIQSGRHPAVVPPPRPMIVMLPEMPVSGMNGYAYMAWGGRWTTYRPT